MEGTAAWGATVEGAAAAEIQQLVGAVAAGSASALGTMSPPGGAAAAALSRCRPQRHQWCCRQGAHKMLYRCAAAVVRVRVGVVVVAQS